MVSATYNTEENPLYCNKENRSISVLLYKGSLKVDSPGFNVRSPLNRVSVSSIILLNHYVHFYLTSWSYGHTQTIVVYGVQPTCRANSVLLASNKRE